MSYVPHICGGAHELGRESEFGDVPHIQDDMTEYPDRIQRRTDLVMHRAMSDAEFEPEFVAACIDLVESADEEELAYWLRQAAIHISELEMHLEEEVERIVAASDRGTS